MSLDEFIGSQKHSLNKHWADQGRIGELQINVYNSLNALILPGVLYQESDISDPHAKAQLIWEKRAEGFTGRLKISVGQDRGFTGRHEKALDLIKTKLEEHGIKLRQKDSSMGSSLEIDMEQPDLLQKLGKLENEVLGRVKKALPKADPEKIGDRAYDAQEWIFRRADGTAFDPKQAEQVLKIAQKKATNNFDGAAKDLGIPSGSHVARISAETRTGAARGMVDDQS